MFRDDMFRDPHRIESACASTCPVDERLGPVPINRERLILTLQLSAIQVALGLLTGFVESWSVGEAIYFTFVTLLVAPASKLNPRFLAGQRHSRGDRVAHRI